MSNEKFTPGVWTAHLGIMEPTFVHTGKEDDYVDGETPVICELHHGIKKKHPGTYAMDFDHTEMNANAALIAAAPEMYEFIRWIASVEGQCAILIKDPEIVRKAQQIIKKARGEE